MFYRKLTRNELKIELSKPAKEVRINDLKITDNGRLKILIDDVIFESFFSNSDQKRLFVCLTDAATSLYPTFQRASWQSTLEGMFLCFDDPTKNRPIPPPIPLTYYFGENNNNYADLLIQIVRKIASLHSIPVQDIVFIGSSMAGFAALYCCDKLIGSKCLTFNPQFFIKDWLESRTFFNDKDYEKLFSISFNDGINKNRIDLSDIYKNKESRFFIFINTESEPDKHQIDKFCFLNKFKYKRGIQKINNILLYISPFKAPHPHQVFPIEQTCKVFLNSLYRFSIDSCDEDVYSAFISINAWYNRNLMSKT